MEVGYNYQIDFDVTKNWETSTRTKRLALDPLKLSLNWAKTAWQITPKMEDLYKVTKASYRIGFAMLLPQKTARLGQKIHQLFCFKNVMSPEFGYHFVETVGTTIQVGSSIIGAVKFADQCEWIRLPTSADALFTPIATLGMVTSIGFSVKWTR